LNELSFLNNGAAERRGLLGEMKGKEKYGKSLLRGWGRSISVYFL
jgi:hypothetical protein